MWGLVLGMAVVFVTKGANMLAMKKVESKQGSSILQALIFTMLFSAAQLVFTLLMPPYRPLSVSLDAILYPTAYAVLYIVAYVLCMKAYSEGSVSMTNAIWSFNTVVVIAYGVCFWGETLSFWQILGLLLFFAGLFFYSRSSYATNEVKKKVTAKWLILTIAATVTIGAATTFTKLFMLKHGDMGKEFLVYYAIAATIISGVICLCMGAKETVKTVADKHVLLQTIIAGFTCVLWNFVYVTYLAVYPSAVFLPLYSVVSMLGILAFGVVLLKEKISRNAIIASVLSLASILFLNLQ